MLFCFKLHADVTAFNHYSLKKGAFTGNIKAITEDRNGFLWIGTSTGLFKFDGIAFDQIDTSVIAQEINIQDLTTGHAGEVLIGTKNHGLLFYQNHELKPSIDDQNRVTRISDIIKIRDKILLATNAGVFALLTTGAIKRIDADSLSTFDDKKLNAIEVLNEQFMAVAEPRSVHLLNTINDDIETILLDQEFIVHDLFQDTHKNLWIATSTGILRYDWQSRMTLSIPELKGASRILSITQFEDDLWVASIDGGIYQINIDTLETIQHTNQNDNIYSLSDKNITSIYISTQGILWAGGFSHGLNSLNLNLSGFKYETFAKNSIDCATKDPQIFSLNKDKNGNLWIGKNDGLVIWNPPRNECHFIQDISNSKSRGFAVYHTLIDDQDIWISSSKGLLHYDTRTDLITSFNNELHQLTAFFTHKINNQTLLLGSSQGLYEYHILNSTYKQIAVSDQKYNRISYRNYIMDKSGHFYFPTTQGVLQLTDGNQIEAFTTANGEFLHKEILAMAINDKDEMFISVWPSGLYHLDHQRNILHHYFDQQDATTILQIRPHNIDQLWLSSHKGLISLDLATKTSSFYASKSAENYLSLTQTSYIDNNNRLYFGGDKGLISFDPKRIKAAQTPSPLIFHELYVMNEPVNTSMPTQTDFILSKPIDKTDHLEFTYKDKIIGFEFIQLNYDNPTDIKYSYRLKPISSKWTALDNNSNRLTFTNLKSGHYQLDIKASQFNNISEKSIGFTVKTAPWLSWWAFVIYAISIVIMVYLFFKRKIAVEQKINTYLNQQVKQKTQKVEELLARKNEIFSNVSHEFRTPLTLILGPIEELYHTEKEKKKKDSLAMVSRNAQQLLNLVNQMLKLAHVNEIDKTQKHVINLSSRLNMIIEPFVYLAKKNSIQLTVKPIENIKLSLTEDALEIIFSNLLSNAIKYIGTGDHITIGNELIDDHVNIYVQDNGPGIDKMDQDKIFKRFNRLHQGSTQGVGIGLALVKEIAELNQAKLNVISEINHGAKFSVSFAIDESIQNHDETSSIAEDLFNNGFEESDTGTKHTVLIIDDNDDMRHYINNVLTQHFKCLLAVDGADGIAKALKYVPDIIVCDVMMPKIDGFQVSRQLRNDAITSHIPLVLLTALDEKNSRIKGWRENIDRYLNKPFDAQELILQLKSILHTRYLLNKNNNKKQPTKEITYLSKTDQDFIDKLQKIIEENYIDPLLNLEKMAGLMLVSDRQLQRKTTALINKSPTDFLKEIRLKKATALLIEGKRVSYISDVCGFSSVSYFSYTFKKHFGMTAKAYQKLEHIKKLPHK